MFRGPTNLVMNLRYELLKWTITNNFFLITPYFSPNDDTPYAMYGKPGGVPHEIPNWSFGVFDESAAGPFLPVALLRQ